MYGSEGRNAALGKAEVQAAPVRFPLIQFNARDIKDLKVVKDETPATIDDPAVVILEAPEALPTAKAPEASSNAAPSLFEAASAESKKHYNSSSHSRPANRGPPRPRPTGPVGDLTTEFDIEASNAKLSTLSLDGDSAPAAKAYDKTASFFDTMSSDMKDRAERSKNPMYANSRTCHTVLLTIALLGLVARCALLRELRTWILLVTIPTMSLRTAAAVAVGVAAVVAVARTATTSSATTVTTTSPTTATMTKGGITRAITAAATTTTTTSLASRGRPTTTPTATRRRLKEDAKRRKEHALGVLEADDDADEDCDDLVAGKQVCFAVNCSPSCILSLVFFVSDVFVSVFAI